MYNLSYIRGLTRALLCTFAHGTLGGSLWYVRCTNAAFRKKTLTVFQILYYFPKFVGSNTFQNFRTESLDIYTVSITVADPPHIFILVFFAEKSQIYDRVNFCVHCKSGIQALKDIAKHVSSSSQCVKIYFLVDKIR